MKLDQRPLFAATLCAAAVALCASSAHARPERPPRTAEPANKPHKAKGKLLNAAHGGPQNKTFVDFNGDGKSDVFSVWLDKGKLLWRYAPGGNGAWVSLIHNGTPLEQLRFGDFDGDGKSDVMVPTSGGYKYYSVGKRRFVDLGAISAPLSRIRLVDFDGDGRTDLFRAQFSGSDNSVWSWRRSADGKWRNIRVHGPTPVLETMRFVDFDGDGATDILCRGCGHGLAWKAFPHAQPKAINMRDLGVPLDSLRFGDFDGDGKTDAFTIQMVAGQLRYRYSSGCHSAWKDLGAGMAHLDRLRFGDFNGDGKTDVFVIKYVNGKNNWGVSYGGTAPWKIIRAGTGFVSDLR